MGFNPCDLRDDVAMFLAPEEFIGRPGKAKEFIDCRILLQKLRDRRAAHSSDRCFWESGSQIGQNRRSHDKIADPVWHSHQDIPRLLRHKPPIRPTKYSGMEPRLSILMPPQKGKGAFIPFAKNKFINCSVFYLCAFVFTRANLYKLAPRSRLRCSAKYIVQFMILFFANGIRSRLRRDVSNKNETL